MDRNHRINKLLEFYTATPNDTFVIYALANEYVQCGQDDEALKYYNILQENFPDYVATYYHLGKLYARRELKDEALEIYKTGIEKAKLAKDNHSLAELQTAFTNLDLGLDDE